MFNSNLSPSSTLSSHSWPNFPVSTGLRPRLSLSSPGLPSGDCRFILLHPSIPDQRCSCQGFRLNQSRPGANCECGHQACYHAQGPIQGPTEESVSPTAPHAPLLDRIYRLEEQYHHDRKIWQDELKEERRARLEDARILREAMHSFYNFMEREVPQRFVHVEDKIEGFLDQLLRLQERVGAIDDSTMALENRVSDLEGDGDDENGREDEEEERKRGGNEEGGRGREENKEQGQRGLEDKDQDDKDDQPEEEDRKEYELEAGEHSEGERKPKRLRTREATSTSDDKTSSNDMSNISDMTTACDCGGEQSTTEAPSLASVKSQSPSPSPTPLLTIRPSSTKLSSARDLSPATDFACPLEFLSAPAPIPVAHNYVHDLLSPARDLISQLVPKVRLSTNYPHHLQPQCQDGHPDIHTHPPVIDSLVTETPQNFTNPWSSPPRPSLLPTSSHMSSANNDLMKKRKRDMNNYQSQGADDGHGQQLVLPMPPPLSLSGSDVPA